MIERDMMSEVKIISEEEFRSYLKQVLEIFFKLEHPKSVTGPGRSGAIAAAYASHYLKIPFIPYKQIPGEDIRPLLIIDTASKSGRTLRKAASFYRDRDVEFTSFWFYDEPPRVKFWYEVLNE